MRAQRLVHVARGRVRAGRVQQGKGIGEVEGHAPVAPAQRAHPRPHHLARRAQRVEVLRPIAGKARGQHIRLQRAGGDGRALDLLDDVEQGVGPAAHRGPRAGGDALPGQGEAGQGRVIHGLDLLAQAGQRPPPQGGQHLGVAPFPAAPAGEERALHDAAGLGQLGQRALRHHLAQGVAMRDFLAREGAVGARVAGDDLSEGMGRGLQEGLGQAERGWNAEGVAQPARVLRRRPPLLAGQAHADDAALARELVRPGAREGGRIGRRPFPA